MSPLKGIMHRQVEARVEIADLYTRYFFAVDHNHAQQVGELFTDDGVLISEVMGWECRGRAAISDYINTLRSSWAEIRIHTAVPDIEIVDATHATGRCYFTVFSAKGVDHWGTYADIFENREGAWLFLQRSIALAGRSAASRAGEADLAPPAERAQTARPRIDR
jgi:hypothetical protein